jgi:hypothetical protein
VVIAVPAIGLKSSMVMGSEPSGARSTTESNDTSSLASVRSMPYVASLQRVSMSTKLKRSLEGGVLQRMGHAKYRLRVFRCRIHESTNNPTMLELFSDKAFQESWVFDEDIV